MLQSVRLKQEIEEKPIKTEQGHDEEDSDDEEDEPLSAR